MSGIGEALLISAATSLVSAGLTYVLTPTQKLESGRINDLTTPKSNYGASLPWCWGKVRVGGNLIWSTFLEEDKNTTRQGKGAKVQTTNYSYYGSFAVMFAECPFRPLADIPRVWMNKRLVYSKVGGAETIAEGGKFAEQYLRFYLGLKNQDIDPLLQNVDPIQNYSYGIPNNRTDRDAYLRSLGIDPSQTAYTPAYNRRAYMVAQRLPLDDFFSSLPAVEAEIVGSNNCTAGQIIRDIFGLFYPSNRFDVSLISTTEFSCEGFFVNSVEAAKNAVQNLQKAFFFDIVESEGVFKFIPLNHTKTAINLVSQDLAAYQAGTQKPVDYEVIEADPTTLPSEVVVSYIDKDLNYDQNEQRSGGEVKNHYNPNPLTLNFNMVMSASQAATIADRSFFLGLLLSKTYKFQLPWAYLNLEPGDLIPNVFESTGQLSSNVASFLKLTQIRIGANLILDCEAVPHDISFWNYTRNIISGSVTVGVASYTIAIAINGKVFAVSDKVTGRLYVQDEDYIIDASGSVLALSAGAIGIGTELVISTTRPVTAEGDDLGTISSRGNTELLVLDIPLIRDEDADYTLYLAAAGGANWNGASIYVSTDNSRYIFAASTKTHSVYGTILGFTANSYTVKVNKSELESITNADLALGLNLALVGNKIIQFKTAQLIDVNTYQLSGIVNNLRGTETQPQPSAGDRFVVLKSAVNNVLKIVGSLLDLGEMRYFKAVSSGQTLSEATPVQLIVQGISQRPYAPLELAATKDGVGNINITWTRRDRHAALNTENPPLSEGQQEYLIHIINSANNTVARVASSYINSYTYQSSLQVADFGSLRTTITVKVAQVSSDVGNGSFATATLTPVYSEPTPQITSFTPASAAIGETVTATGTSLAQVSAIEIGDINQTNLAVIDNQTISFVVAYGTVSGSIKAVTPGGTARSFNALIIQEKELLIKDRFYDIPGDFPDVQTALLSFGNKILSNITLKLEPGNFPGNLLLGNLITTPAGLKIIGSGVNQTTIQGNIDIAAVGANIFIEDLKIIPVNSPENKPGINCRNKINLVAHNLKIENFPIGINLASCSTADIENTTIQSCSIYGLQAGSNSTANVATTTITGCGDGFFANNSSSLICSGCSSTNNLGYGFRCEVNSAIYTTSSTVSNNQSGNYNVPGSGTPNSSNGIIFF